MTDFSPKYAGSNFVIYFFKRHTFMFPPNSLVKLVQIFVYISRILGALTKRIRFYDTDLDRKKVCADVQQTRNDNDHIMLRKVNTRNIYA